MTNSENKKKKHRRTKINNGLIAIMLLTILSVLIAFGINIYNILNSSTGEGETVEVEPADNALVNDYYTIGNNPTDINKEYFEEITKAYEEEGADTEKASAVVRTFITEYYTWTNKDGNYDIGGMQYIYTDKQSDFETYTLNNFYVDMDLYLTQIGRSGLMEVSEVTIESAEQIDDFISEDGSVTLSCFNVVASWKYTEDSQMDTSGLQNYATFKVANNNGRFEIVGIE